ncbi:polysaccharide pyruvyl transferase family protein [Georgenia subflava]|uniref:polysaccharide pyruvyl transferase family protein n=1 Tax=Georgenia subflava TaxID=1622177 RepID=UPI00128CA580|nr:polysaccharide pyruvyl transferase family protein [Georgenia subflava]
MTELRLVLAGALVRNDNRGVEALARSVLDAIALREASTYLSVLDDGWGVRRDGDSSGLSLEFVGVRLSRRWHRPESWAQIRLAQALRSRINPAAQRISHADALLDISGGDSFTDLYGQARLDAICAPKEAALRAGRPLVLLPQTFGPFTGQASRRRAERIVQRSTVAYARDALSYERLLELGGPDADTGRLRSGVDVAFALEPREPSGEVVRLLGDHPGEVLAGVNVSGLLVEESRAARFGLRGNYLATMTSLVRELIGVGARPVLVPHVHGAGGESDLAAALAVRDSLSPHERDAVMILPAELRAAELKWCIAQLDWFAGSRMHATIASLSSGVPTFGYAYSDKAEGVFAMCGSGAHHGDARQTTGAAAVEMMMHSFDQRERAASDLARTTPSVVALARQQLADLLSEIASWHGSPMPIGTVA